MARTPGRKINKKHHTSSKNTKYPAHVRKELSMVYSHCYQRFRIIGDCTIKPMALGLSRLHVSLHEEKRKIIYDTLLRSMAREQKWGIALSCFFYCDDNEEKFNGAGIPWGGRIAAIEATAVAHQFTGLDIGECLNGLLSEMIHQCQNVHSTCHKDNFIYYGYTIIPEMDATSMTLGEWLTNTLVRVADLDSTRYFRDSIPIVDCDNRLVHESIANAGLLPNEKKCPLNYMELSSYDYSTDESDKEEEMFLFNPDIVAKNPITDA